jgi:tetratricopeptide (TPR) repeat protein
MIGALYFEKSMWLTSRGDTLIQHSGRLILSCSLEHGVYALISKLTEETPRIWLEFSESDCYDDLAQGDKLAEACTHALGSRLHALPYQYGMSVLKSSLMTLEPHVFVLTNAHYAPEFAKEFLTLHRAGHRVIAHFGQPIASIVNHLPGDAKVFDNNDLKLSLEEAYELAGKRLLPHEVEEMYEASQGAHDLFVVELCKRLHVPPPLTSGPNGPKFLGDVLSELGATERLDLLVSQKRWLEALEFTVTYLPEQTSEVLSEAGHVFHERGLHKRLWGLLSPLPEKLKDDECILYWLLNAAFRLGKEQELASVVKDYLQKHEAPELRALYAGVLAPYDEALSQAQRAYNAKPNAFTLYQLGAKTPSTKESIELLEASVKLATDEGRGYEIVRNIVVLIERLILQGSYASAASWGEWALAEFDKRSLKDNLCRLDILNAWAYARILNGELAGLEPLLAENIIHLERAYPSLARLFRSTLGDYLIASGRAHEALKHFEINFSELESVSHYNLSIATHNLTRVFIELGMISDALELTKRTLNFFENKSTFTARYANLAYGMVLAFYKPDKAQDYLESARQGFIESFVAPYIVESSIYLAFVKHSLGQPNEARLLLKQIGEPLTNLASSGLKLLSGPEDHFRDVLSFIRGNNDIALELRLFGEGEVWLNNEKLTVPPLWLEILSILCLKERSITPEELLSFLYGDGGSKDNLKTNLSKMRRVFPITQNTYQLTLSYSTDVTIIQDLLARGNVAGALKLYKGSILPHSNSPFIRHIDEVLSETIRQATLNSEDSEALFSLLEYDDEDLEILETLSATIGPSDPRRALVGAKLKQLHKEFEVRDPHTMLLA